ncbi:major tail tube protein [Hartmannibacter diazotrophicus]|uniref:Major tail tube protein n=1 Tax=Hartmannibacter diazotrophicus TaxID=1482074 RepID=A0A2C9D5W8_9HYPH|nr:phage major tail tube protein [Hartmannibacter diazotrophicus]SON55538.1 major tail tube protein [Hartmannibacter diazotrophicus]
MQPLYVLQAVDVRRATVAGSSRATTVQKLVIPPIKFMNANHNPGGGVMSVDFTLPRTEPIEPTFMVKGIDTDIFDGMGFADEWTFAGAFRDKQSGAMVPMRAVIKGAISEWEPDESDPADFIGCNHIFKEVTHFDLTMDGKELYYIDFWERVLRVSGNDLFADIRSALGA